MFDAPDYELAWPRDLFVAEASALIASGHATDEDRVGCLLEEAFTSSGPWDDFTAAGSTTFDDPWAVPLGAAEIEAAGTPSAMKDQFLATLVKNADSLREASTPRPYWPERVAAQSAAHQLEPDLHAAKRRFVQLINQFSRDGYLERVFPRECVDGPFDVAVDESARLQEHLGVPNLWPLRPAEWDDDIFYGLVEVFHDLVARPRNRHYHSWNQCGWHYSSYAIAPARALYRRRVNKLLEVAALELRLAEEGEDTGRLVHLIDDERRALVEQVLRSPDPKAGDQVEHAIALFRGRTSTLQEKRSAVVALAHVLESRRALLKTELLRGDEGALFHIANGFAIRHESESQKADYDPVFLDWVFWWYLATIELSDRLLARANK
ncbi:hypothetical protein O7627_27490 [Solwaraspora sp. WMMD1047]|uniref:hypothetical protein n=1 Tax=Solwaraspora sp. WMMD1047 TaxID=3016102 RepID=UPI002416F3BF|nr:hypothetical protein [Solwaraspora sp. WMMD1047]MDG4833021.1 hypothetical protein [Solwaraspora sp. WMMD1047]